MAGPWEKYQQPTQQAQSEGPWSKFKPQAPQQAEEPSLKDKIINKAIQAGEIVDRYTGAPTRAAIGAAIDGENPISAYAKQFGEQSNLAPTGKEIAQKVGIPDTSLSDVAPGLFTNDDKEAEKWLKFKKGGAADISASGAAGLGVDVLADPSNLIGVGEVKGALQTGLKGVGAVAKTAGSTAIKGLKDSAIAAKVGEFASKGAVAAGHALTGVPTRNIEVYAKHTDEINNMIKKYGGDVALMADDTRAGFNKAIETTKSGLNKSIDQALSVAPKEKTIDVSWARDAIDNAKSKVNATLYPEVLKELDDLHLKVANVSDGWKVNAKELNDLKKYAQDLAKGSYKKDGQIFVLSGDVAKTAKEIGSKFRKQLNDISPEVAQANNKLAMLHNIDDKINKNILGVGKSESALINAGAGTNTRAIRQIKEVGNIVGKDFIGEAEKLSAAKQFSNTPILPVDTTGKSMARVGAGYVLGGIPGAALTSPLTLKAAINAKKIPQSVVSVFSKGKSLTDDVVEGAFNKINTPAGKRIIEDITRGSRVASIGSGKTAAKQGVDGDTNIATTKGPTKWAMSGYVKLIGQDPMFNSDSFYQKAMADQKLKTLLIKASDLEPGSKAMSNIIAQMKEIGGE